MALSENTPPRKQIVNEDTKINWWQPALIMFGRMSFWVVAPVVLGLVVGRWLDRILDAEPWGLISVVGLAFVISMIGLVKEASREYEKIANENKESKK